MAEKLTPQQKLAVEHRGGRLLISAAAGSGKTKVLVDRLIGYLTDEIDPANIDDFLIITYTKAAAGELRAKITEKLTAYIAEHPENRHMQQQLQRIYLAKISTVHAFCADLLREFVYQTDLPADFRIAEESEMQEIMLRVLDRLLEEAYTEDLDDPQFRAFIDTQGLGRDDRQVPEIILQLYSAALCHLDPDAWLDQCAKASCQEENVDASNTLWGSFLMEDVKSYITLQLDAFDNCIRRAEQVPGLEKPVANIKTTAADLKDLIQCNTWDALVNHPPVRYGTLTFTKEHRGSQLAEQIKAVRNHCKANLPKKLRPFADDSATVLSQLSQASEATIGLISLVKRFKDRFEQAKRARRVLDFSDIEQRTLDLLWGKKRNSVTALSAEIGCRYREVMVDEYQDSNEVQDAIFSALTMHRGNCFMVGDVKQSIYQFRLADPGIFLNKYHKFMDAECPLEEGDRKIMLSSNFRSSGGVISAVNDVFSHCMSKTVGGLTYTKEQMLVEGIAHIPLNAPEVALYGIEVREDTYREEAEFVAQKIHDLLDGTHMVRQADTLRPIVPDDIVILLRSPGSVGGEYRYALEQWGIGCTMGGDLDLLEMPEIDTLKSILQIIDNPLQDIPMIAALCSPVFGFTADELAAIRSSDRYAPFYAAVRRYDSPKSAVFLSVLTQLRREARFMSITELIHSIFLKTHMLSIYSAMDNGVNVAKNLQMFCQIASDYEKTGHKDLSYFLEYLKTMEVNGLRIPDAGSSGTVRIMSIHKSKGLEFPVVFLCGLSRSFNMSDMQKQVLSHKELGIGMACVNNRQRVRFPTIAKLAIAAKISQDTISEEMRVLYVAMTRARDRLIMTYAAGNLEDTLRDLVLRMDVSSSDLLCAYVNRPGTWILQTALRRTESGEFFHLAGYPEQTKVSDHPWAVHVVQAPLTAAASILTEETIGIENEILDKMQRGLSFRYPYTDSVQIPSKVTATQLKGRLKDREAAEYTTSASATEHSFRTPQQHKEQSGTEYGNIHHKVLQYLNFDQCMDAEGIQLELVRLNRDRIITAEQMECVDQKSLLRFFQSELGQLICAGHQVLREFKFSILEDAQAYYPDVRGEKILLQGVVDCAVIEKDGITILDFKTDRVNVDTVEDRAALYRPQVRVYADALSKIYGLPVKGAFLYFLRISKSIQIQ